MRFDQPARISAGHAAYLDAWRGGAAIAVLIGHSLQIFTRNPNPIWGGFAGAAVMAFFVLSGFFIQKSLANSFAKGRPFSFVTARVNRIGAPFLFALALTVALAFASRTFFPRGVDALSLEYLPSTLLFVNGFFGGTLKSNGALWSLSFEIWYYVLAFLLALAATGKRIGWVALPIFALLTYRNVGFLILGSVWLAGFGISILHNAGRLRRLPLWPFLVLVALALVPFSRAQSDLTAIWTFEVAAGMAFAVHLIRVLLLDRPPRVRWLPSTAGFSYTLYVVHFPLLLFAYGVSGERWQMMIPTALGILIASALVGRRLEHIRVVPDQSEGRIPRTTESQSNIVAQSSLAQHISKD